MSDHIRELVLEVLRSVTVIRDGYALPLSPSATYVILADDVLGQLTGLEVYWGPTPSHHRRVIIESLDLCPGLWEEADRGLLTLTEAAR